MKNKKRLTKILIISLTLSLISSIYIPSRTDAYIDNQNPNIKDSELIAYPNISGGIYNDSLQIKLYSSGEDTLIYYTLNGKDPTIYGQVYRLPVNINTEGITTIKYYAADDNGNKTPIYRESYLIDYTKPKAMAFPVGGYYNHSLKLILSLSETGEIYYTLNGKNPTTSSAKYTAPITLNEGITTVKYMGIDKAGNQTRIYEQTYNVDLDNTVKASPSSTISNQSLTITLSAKQGNIYYTVDGSDPTTKSLKYTEPIHINREGITTLKYMLVDSQGIKNAIYTEYYLLDKAAPETTFLINGRRGFNDWYVEDVKIDLLGEDNHGIEETYYSLNGGPWKRYEDTIKVSVEGLNTIYYYSGDFAGYNEGVQKETFKIDKTGPKIVIYTPKDGFNYELNESIYAYWSATDNYSGLDKSTGTVENGEQISTNTKGEREFTVIAEDKAGNSAEVKSVYYVGYEPQDNIITDNSVQILPPLYLDRDNVIKQGRTVPVKFRLTDNNSYNDKRFALYIAKIDGNVAGKELKVSSPGKSNSGNLFKYDKNEKQYSFNLSTKGMSKGLWQLRIELDKSHSVYLNLLIR